MQLPPSDTLASGISINELTIAFPNRPAILDRVTFDIDAGEIVALVGASGSGKSTLLKAIARLVQPVSGSIEFPAGAPSRRPGDLAFVFQDPTLLPWRTVAENVGLPLELGPLDLGPSRKNVDRRERIQLALDSVGLTAADTRKYPRELSGGMRMRTSIARALVTDPNVLLLDEPFAALDDILRSRLNDLILQLWSARPRTIVFVTHNIAEAVYLSHRIAVVGNRTIFKVLVNDLDWPRGAHQRSALEFAGLYGKVSQALGEVAG